MDPRERLKAARLAAAEGRFEDALRDHVWFHEHALAHDFALYGVRLSFALADWIALGDKYPPALRSLESVRDTKTAALLDGARDRRLFHDVVAINDRLGARSGTCELFRRLCDLDEDFAWSCANLAMAALIAAKDFALASRFLTDPEAAVASSSSRLNDDVRELRDPARATRYLDRKLAAQAHIHAEDVDQILAVLVGSGRVELAKTLRVAAIDGVEDEAVRASVCELLSRSQLEDAP